MRSAYRLALHSHYGVGDIGGSSNSNQGRAGWKKLWQAKVPSKVSFFFFAMKIVNNGLPTRVNKKYRHLKQQDTCQLCGQQQDAYHALLICPHALALRQATRQHWLLLAEQNLSWTGPEWLLLLAHNNSLEVLANLFMLLWHTWNFRIKMIHIPFIASSVTFLTRYMHSLVSIQQEDVEDLKGKRCLQSVSGSGRKLSRPQGAKRWKPPVHGTFKINVNAALLASHSPLQDTEEAEARAGLWFSIAGTLKKLKLTRLRPLGMITLKYDKSLMRCEKLEDSWTICGWSRWVDIRITWRTSWHSLLLSLACVSGFFFFCLFSKVGCFTLL